MSAAKKRKNKGVVPAWLRKAGRWLFGPGRSALIAAAVAAAVGGGIYWAWQEWQDRMLGGPEYRLDPRLVEITPPPDWIHSDIRAEVFRDPALAGRLSIMDEKLGERLARAFERHPWVANVRLVRLHHPSSASVELEYRRPACMVETGGGLYPVDVEGVLLPGGDFSPGEKAGYPRLGGVERIPNVPPGSRWPDARIVGGAEIAAALRSDWEAMDLQRIVPLIADRTVSGARGNPRGRAAPSRTVEPIFALLTRRGTQITWGYAPGAGAVGEPPSAEKVARLKRYLAEHDTLDGRDGRPQKLDVRTMPPSVAR